MSLLWVRLQDVVRQEVHTLSVGNGGYFGPGPNLP